MPTVTPAKEAIIIDNIAAGVPYREIAAKENTSLGSMSRIKNKPSNQARLAEQAQRIYELVPSCISLDSRAVKTSLQLLNHITDPTVAKNRTALEAIPDMLAAVKTGLDVSKRLQQAVGLGNNDRQGNVFVQVNNTTNILQGMEQEQLDFIKYRKQQAQAALIEEKSITIDTPPEGEK